MDNTAVSSSCGPFSFWGDPRQPTEQKNFASHEWQTLQIRENHLFATCCSKHAEMVPSPDCVLLNTPLVCCCGTLPPVSRQPSPRPGDWECDKCQTSNFARRAARFSAQLRALYARVGRRVARSASILLLALALANCIALAFA